ncbi:hypothetical protein [Bacillus sp. FSL K6-3431]|uniref:hypothetical protein n=1 Tax=Bacillus sp. FSL K6-3431 TaxID=2921500 RepID=UPI0030F842B5
MRSAKDMKETLNNLGLSIVDCHVNLLNIDRLPAVLDYHQELGYKQIGLAFNFIHIRIWTTSDVAANCSIM